MAHVVELDGSYRKTRLVSTMSAAVGASDDPMRPDVIAEAVREALDTEGMKGEITLAHPCREAVLRIIELPFKGADAIRKVVKSEIEGEIFTHSVDDMVVDFHPVGEALTGDTRVLVASVPKIGLRNQLTSLQAQSVDPARVDLDTMALWRAADWVGAFDEDDDDDDTDEVPVHAVIDLGARSVKVVLTEGEDLAEMRVLRLGEAVVADQVARQHGLHAEQASQAVRDCLSSGGDVRVALSADLPAVVGGDAVLGDSKDGELDVGKLDDGEQDDGRGPASAVAAPGASAGGGDDKLDEEDFLFEEIGADEGGAKGAASEAGAVAPVDAAGVALVTYNEVDAAHTKYLKRLARELTRFLTASGRAARIRSVWISGSACRGRGVYEMLEAVFGVAPQELDVLSNLAHGLDDDEAEELSPQLAVAVGLALGRFGGPQGFQLRQEDLVQTGGFDRIKFPLAIACVFGLLALFVYGQVKVMKLSVLELKLGTRAPTEGGGVEYHGILHPIMRSNWIRDKQTFGLKKRGSSRITYAFNDLVAELDELPVHARVKKVLDRLGEVASQKQKESGIYQDVKLESGLAVLVRWAEMMKAIEPQLGRYLVPLLDVDMKKRKLEFKIAFRGEDFRTRMSVVKRAIEQEIGRPESPFMAPEQGLQSPPDQPFDNRDQPSVSGAYYKFDIDIKDPFPTFGPSGRVGMLFPADLKAKDRSNRVEVG
ncbi:MAG: pilus assembly protein PilM [Planctomycetota bacterium]